MEMESNPSVVFEADNDDDAFYAEIRRQILLLTSEDNEDLLAESRDFNNNVSSVNDGGSKRSNYSFKGSSASSSAAAAPASNFCSWETESYYDSPPVWLVNLWKHGKGTGVFIPQVSCRKNHRQGRNRMNNGRRRIYRQVVNKD